MDRGSSSRDGYSSPGRRWGAELDRHLERLDDERYNRRRGDGDDGRSPGGRRDGGSSSRMSSGRASPQDDPEDLFRGMTSLRPGGMRSSGRAGAGRLGRSKRSQSEQIFDTRSLRLALPKRPEDGVEEMFHRLPDGMLSPKSARLKELSDKIRKERRKQNSLKIKGKAWATMADNYKAQIEDFQESTDKIRSEFDDIQGHKRADDREFKDKYKMIETSRVAEEAKDDRDDGRRRRDDSPGSRRRRGDDYLIDSRLSSSRGDRRSGDRDARRSSKELRRRGEAGGGGMYWMSRAERRDSISRGSSGGRSKGSLGRVGRRHTTFF